MGEYSHQHDNLNPTWLLRISKMRTKPTAPKNIDEYIAGFPGDVQKILKKIRLTIRQAAPGAQEAIKYQMPTFTMNGNLVYFAAFNTHIGLYPLPRGIEKFKRELSAYESGKGSVRFPLNEPIPFPLISRIVKFRMQQQMARAAEKKKKR
jgi:uncharacterized protein YdhG (YjbR/CyaY superfamily)